MFSQNTHQKVRNRGDIVRHYVQITFGAGLVNPTAVEQGGTNIWTVTQANALGVATAGLFTLKAAPDLTKRPGFIVGIMATWVAANTTQDGAAQLAAVPVAASPQSAVPWSQTNGILQFKTQTTAGGVLTSPPVGSQVFLEITMRQNKINATNL